MRELLPVYRVPVISQLCVMDGLESGVRATFMSHSEIEGGFTKSPAKADCDDLSRLKERRISLNP